MSYILFVKYLNVVDAVMKSEEYMYSSTELVMAEYCQSAHACTHFVLMLNMLWILVFIVLFFSTKELDQLLNPLRLKEVREETEKLSRSLSNRFVH